MLPPGAATPGRRDPGLYGPDSRGVAAQSRGDAPARGRAAGAAAPDRASAGRGRRQRPQRLPGRPVAPAGRHAAELPDDRLRIDRRGAGGDPAAERASIEGSPGPATRRATPSCRCGSTRRSSTRRWPSPTRGWSRCRRRVARRYYAETLPIGRAFGVPDALLPPDLAAFERYVDGDAGAGRAGPGLAGRPRARRGRAATATRAAGTLLPLPAAGTAGARGRAGGCVCLDPVAVGRSVAGVGPRRLRPGVGCARADRVGLAGRRLPGLAAAAAGVLPPDAQGARRRSTDGRRAT